MSEQSTIGGSVFDEILTDASNQQQESTSTNEGNATELLSKLLSAASNSKDSTDKEEEKVDYSTLFGKPANKVTSTQESLTSETTEKSSTLSDGSPGGSAKDSGGVETPFLDSLGSQEAVEALIKNVAPVDFQLSPEINALLADENGDGFTVDIMRQAIGLSMQQVQQAALQQTISLINGAIPEIITKAQQDALTKVNQETQLNKATKQFKGNEPLQQLVKALTANTGIQDGAATAQQVQAMLADIVKNQIKLNEESAPKKSKGPVKFEDYVKSI
jgi:hypothetical protein